MANIDGADIANLFKIREKWDDFTFNVSNLKTNPVTSKPDFDFAEGEYLFDATTTETVIGGNITSHSFKLPTAEWRPHVHWMQTQSGNVKWQLEYKIITPNTVEPVSWTTSTTTTTAFTYTSGNLHQISVFPAINMSGYASTALMFKFKLSRLGADGADTYAVDARLLQFDVHVIVDDFGSTSEFLND